MLHRYCCLRLQVHLAGHPFKTFPRSISADQFTGNSVCRILLSKFPAHRRLHSHQRAIENVGQSIVGPCYCRGLFTVSSDAGGNISGNYLLIPSVLDQAVEKIHSGVVLKAERRAKDDSKTK